jgi:hypothetical protein
MLRNWSSGTWSKASGRATVELDQMRTRFLYRSPLTHFTSGVTQEPPQGSCIWLFGAPEIPVSTENSESMQKSSDLSCPAIVSRAWSHSSRRFFHGSLVGSAARAELELEVIALRHQLAVLHRQRPGRHRPFALDRLFWNWLYRVWPRCLNIIVLVKPAPVVQWHRQGFRLYWRWRSRSGRRQ